jgi:hypothetical protein
VDGAFTVEKPLSTRLAPGLLKTLDLIQPLRQQVQLVSFVAGPLYGYFRQTVCQSDPVLQADHELVGLVVVRLPELLEL